jgi:anti-sigma B factor antagonist
MAIDAPLSIERRDSSVPSTRILVLTGPLTLRNLFELQSDLRSGELPKLSIIDLSGVPYMDSAGMGLIINHYVHCQNHGSRMVAVGVSPRVNELFCMTKVDSVISQAATIEEAESAN